MFLHDQRRMQRVFCMLLVLQWRAPKGHDRVADVLVDGAAIALNGFGHMRQVSIHHCRQLGWRQALRDRGEIAHVGKQHGHVAAFTFGRIGAGILGHFVDQFFRHIGTEDTGDLPPGARLDKKSVGHVEEIQEANQQQRQCERQHNALIPPVHIERSDERHRDKNGDGGHDRIHFHQRDRQWQTDQQNHECLDRQVVWWFPFQVVVEVTRQHAGVRFHTRVDLAHG